MLFILTGGVQTGKTRWLERLVDTLGVQGVSCVGVLAPGVWRPGEKAGEREKVGIDNVLLPSGERFRFATRRDLLEESNPDATSQSDKAQLGWAIFDDALERVNGCFEALSGQSEAGAPPEQADGSELLVVDEIGRLELEHGRGLYAAMRLLDEGPAPKRPHALVVVRDWLADDAVRRLEGAWGEPVVIGPDEAGRRAVLGAFRKDRAPLG